MYHLSCIIHHLTPIMNHLSSNTHHATPLIYHLSFTIYPQASCLMTMAMVMIMIMTMVSYQHHEAPRAVRGSVGGCSMDMWCPYGIGREIWDREVLRLVDPDSSPLKGEIPPAGVFPFAGVGGSAHRKSFLLLLLLLLNILLS